MGWPYDVARPTGVLRAQAEELGDAVFARFRGDVRLTFADVAAQAWGYAEGMSRLGVTAGHHVASWQPNGPAAVRDFMGNLVLGSVHTPLNTAYRGSLLQHALNLSECEVLCAHPQLVSRLDGLDLPRLRYVITAPSAADSVPSRLAFVDERELASTTTMPSGLPERHMSETAAMVLTSGTTGPSKGVLQSLAYYEVLARDYLGYLRSGDRYYHCLPPFHQGALVALYTMLQKGGSLFVRDGFRVGEFWPEVRESASTSALLIGGMATMLLKQPEADDDADNPLRAVLVNPLTDAFREFATRFDVVVGTCYGMTEIGTPFSTLDPANGRTVGRLNPGFEARIVDEHDIEIVDADVTGELVTRHSLPWALNSGYKNMPEATAAAWRNGWFHTGDAFRRDAEGNFYYVDRMKDAIRRRGENISSMELESEVLTHPAVREAAALGVPSDTGEDDVLIVISRQPEATVDFVELIEYLTTRLPHYMVPRYLHLMDELPKTPTAKVRKEELRGLDLTAAFDREQAGIRVRRDVLE